MFSNGKDKMHAMDLNFKFLGHRNYVHGSSMLEGMLQAFSHNVLSLESHSAVIRMFKIIREFTCNASVKIMREKDVHHFPGLREAVARLDIAVDREAFSVLLLKKPEQPVFQRLADYDASNYVEDIRILDDGQSAARLKNLGNMIDVVRGIVEANRQITLVEYKDEIKISKMRWAYITDLKIFNPFEVARVREVLFSQKTVVSEPTRLFPVKTLHIDGLNQDSIANICFFIQIEPNGENE